jgi:hypothetical protein
MVGDYGCLNTQQQWAQMGCAGPMAGQCMQNYYMMQQQNELMTMAAVGAGASLAASMLSRSGMFGGGRGSARDSISRSYANSDVPAGSGIVGSSSMDPCGTPPPDIKKALDEAISFKNECSVTRNTVVGDKKIAINDYSKMPATMYIFSADGKTCYGKTAVAYGNGVNQDTGQVCSDGSGRPLPCAEDGCHTTPPGFHITQTHNGLKFNSSNSLAMVGLEGQNSLQRNILIHIEDARAVGSNSTWGCSGVNCFQRVQELLGTGSLVYNYFGDTPLAPRCKESNGMTANRSPSTCHEDGKVPPSPSVPDGDSSAVPEI